MMKKTTGFSVRLRQLRESAGLTQAELAERLGMSEARLARMERRYFEGCSLDLLRRYARALGDGFALEVCLRRPVSAEVPALVAAER